MPKQSEKEFLPVETPHIFVWISNGKELDKEGDPVIGENDLPLPNNRKFNYLTKLRNECRKLKRTNTPVYLVYKGDLLTEGQKAQMENLADDPEMANLCIIDYDGEDFEKWCLAGSADKADQVFVEKMQESTAAFLSGKKDQRVFDGYKKASDALGSIAHLIDLIKLFAIYRCDMLHQIAEQKYQDDPRRMNFLKFIKNSKGALCRDFDVTLGKDKMQPIELINGHISSTSVANLLAKRLKQLKRYIETSKSTLKFENINPVDFQKDMTQYYKAILNNPKKYVELYLIYNKPETSTSEKRMAIESEYLDKSRCFTDISRHPIFKINPLFSSMQQEFKGISDKLSGGVKGEHLFYRDLVSAKVARPENSLIGVSGPRHPGIAREIVNLNNLKKSAVPGYKEVEHGIHTPYSVMQDAMLFPDKENRDGLTQADVNLAMVDHIAHCVLHTDIFKIGNDLSWKAEKSELHAAKTPVKVAGAVKNAVLEVEFTKGDLVEHPAMEFYQAGSWDLHDSTDSDDVTDTDSDDVESEAEYVEEKRPLILEKDSQNAVEALSGPKPSQETMPKEVRKIPGSLQKGFDKGGGL